MTIARIVAEAVVCCGLASCSSGYMEHGHATKPPCPDVVSEGEAVLIAKELVHSQIVQYGGADARATWQDGIWTVYLGETGHPSSLTVMVRADGRVIGCGWTAQCEPDPGIEVPSCRTAAGDIVSKQEAEAIALHYAARNNLTPMSVQVVFISWYGAHWNVWLVPRGPAPLHSDITVFVSPDGSQTEQGQGDFGIPHPDSFLFAEPRLE